MLLLFNRIVVLLSLQSNGNIILLYEYVFDRGLISIFSVLAERDVFLVDLELWAVRKIS